MTPTLEVVAAALALAEDMLQRYPDVWCRTHCTTEISRLVTAYRAAIARKRTGADERPKARLPSADTRDSLYHTCGHPDPDAEVDARWPGWGDFGDWVENSPL